MNLGYPYELSIIQFPSGRWGFVGSVPIELGYVMPDGSIPKAQYVDDQMRLPSKFRTVKYRAFETHSEALTALQEFELRNKGAL